MLSLKRPAIEGERFDCPGCGLPLILDAHARRSYHALPLCDAYLRVVERGGARLLGVLVTETGGD